MIYLMKRLMLLKNIINELILRFEQMSHNFETLEHHMLEEIEETKADIEGIKNDVLEVQEKMMARDKRVSVMEAKVDGVINELKTNLTRIEARILNSGVVFWDASRLYIPKPKFVKAREMQRR